MSGRDTSIGEGDRAFPSTIWSDVLGAEPGSSQGRARLERLLRAYWKPVYVFVRTAWRKPVEDSKDLTQAFFALLLERGHLANVSPERGSFRGYLKTALRHFLINSERAARVRRPEGTLLSIDAVPEVLERLGPEAPDESPEQAYDRAWLKCVIDAGVETLRATLVREGKESYFDSFSAYCLEPGGAEATYADVASRLGCRESDVRYRLAYCRGLLRRILAASVGEYSSGEADAERELREILGE